jgi:TrmH family RNA methyltransferase
MVHYTDLEPFLSQINLPIFGAMLNGDSIYETDFDREGLIVMGNEGNGLRPSVEKLIEKAVTIPRTGGAESLNVAIAAALFCSEVSRKSFK